MKYELNTERPHLFAPNIKVIEKVDIYGVNSVDDLINAIQAACKNYEILNTYIEIDSDGTASYKKTDKEQYVEVSSDDWENIAAFNIAKRYKIEEGELIKFFIIPKDNYIELLIVAHHLAGDGLSIVYLIENIARTLSGEVLPFIPIKIFRGEDFPPNTDLSLVNKLFIKKLNKKWLSIKRVFDFSDAVKIHNLYWNTHAVKFLIHQFSKSETNAIIKIAKNNGVTLNSLLTAMIASVYSDNGEIGLAVSVRNDYRGMSNLVSGISIEYKKKYSLSKNIRHIHESIYTKLNSPCKKYLVLRFLDMVDGSFLDSAYIHQYVTPLTKESDILCRVLKYGENKRNIGISNLSKLDIQTKYGNVYIDNFVFIPPLVPYAKRTYGIATINQRMTLSVHLLDNNDVDKEIKLFNNIVGELKQI